MLEITWAPGKVDFNRTKNRDKGNSPNLSSNYWAPLTDQVEESEKIDLSQIIANNKPIHKQALSKVRRRWKRIMEARTAKRMQTMAKMRQLIECGSVPETKWEQAHSLLSEGKIASAVYDSGATSNCGRPEDPFHETNEKSDKVFNIPNGDRMAATKKAKLKLPVQEPAKTVHILSELEHNTLLSASKFADAGYISILTPTHLYIIDGNEIIRKLKKAAVLKGWRDPASDLWRVPLKEPPPTRPNMSYLQKRLKS